MEEIRREIRAFNKQPRRSSREEERGEREKETNLSSIAVATCRSL